MAVLSAHLRQSWARLVQGFPSWRPLHDLDEHPHFWNEFDAVIVVTTVGRGRHYEGYAYGSLIGNAQNLEEAKRHFEEVYGPLQWRRLAMPEVEAFHYFYGPSKEWTEPNIIYVVDHLPRLGGSNG